MRLLGLMQKAEQILFSPAVERSILRSSGITGHNNLTMTKSDLPSRTRTTSLTLQSLFEQKAHIIERYMVKLKDSGHPILEVANELCLENPTMKLCSFSLSLQLRAVLVLLITKSIGASAGGQFTSKDIQQKIEEKHISISEITELIYSAHMLHRTVINTSDPKSVLHHGNKLAALMGDLLLAKSSRQLSSLRNNRVTELMSQSICDFSESEFIGAKANELFDDRVAHTLNTEIAQEHFHYNNWLRKAELSLGSLLGHACYCSAIFSGHDEAVQKFAFNLGKRVGILLQSYKDISVFEDENGTKLSQNRSFDVLNLPAIYEVVEWFSSSPEVLTKEELFNRVQSSRTAIPRAKETLLSMRQESVRLLQQLDPKARSVEMLSEMLRTFSS